MYYMLCYKFMIRQQNQIWLPLFGEVQPYLFSSKFYLKIDVFSE